MEKILNEYLEKVEKYLKPMAASERIDIVKEIKSEMLELQGNGVSPEQIVERLGNPKELAKAYLSESISKNKGFSWRRLRTVIAFYSLAGIGVCLFCLLRVSAELHSCLPVFFARLRESLNLSRI